jgi:hypothetical protein
MKMRFFKDKTEAPRTPRRVIPTPEYRVIPTPEYMEAFARVEENGTDLRAEMRAMWVNPALSVRFGIEGEQEQHNAVAARWPHLYTTTTDE